MIGLFPSGIKSIKNVSPTQMRPGRHTAFWILSVGRKRTAEHYKMR